MRRYFYISNAFEVKIKKQRRIIGDSPAASGKVIRVCNAVRTQGAQATVISLGRGRQRGSWTWYPPVIKNCEGVPIVYAAYFDAPILTHIVSSFSLLFILLKLSQRDSVLIFYNFLVHYLPSLLVQRFKGRRCILDLEDGFRQDDTSVKGRLNKYLLKIYSSLCNGGAMLASSALASQTSSRPTTVCYSVAPKIQQSPKNWKAQPVRILFGGALFVDTGVDVFLNALTLLLKKDPEISSKLKFIVTGFGDMSETIKAASTNELSDLIDFRGSVDDYEYLALLHESNIGLCLKLPEMSMGATTFPSKVVEMAAYGLLVVTTKVSDVPLLFSDTTGVLLDEATPQNLAEVLFDISEFPEKYMKIALNGQEKISEKLSPELVGSEMLAFWRGDPSPFIN